MNEKAKRAPELLAPAGSVSALRAAVANGADAVYLGVETLNARRGAENFTIETLAEACSFAHLHGVRIYLTANILVLPREIDDAVTLIDRAWAAGVDAVIVQDLGLLRCIRTSLPHVRVHASTQIDTHASDTVRVLADLGVSRVTLAREVSIDEIATLVRTGESAGVEVESFGHGALCICYSGQCLMSSLVGGRSANRGMCAQPCRLPYELEDEAGKAFSTPGAHLLSPKDLASITVLPQLVATGLHAIKIEGRMKSPEYVALVTGVYRRALDRAVAQPEGYEVRDGEMSVLSEAFSRGFSEAYLISERGNDMMSYVRPNNRGVPVGRIAGLDGATATFQLDAPIDEADTIEIWTSRGRFAQPVGPISAEGKRVARAAAGERIQVELAEAASPGDRVFRVRNAALMDAAERTFRDVDESLPIDMVAEIDLVIGEPVRITFRDAHGRTGEATGLVVEKARTRPVGTEDVIEHVGRLGGTPYRVADWSVTLSPGVGIGFSELHRIRREALQAYESVVLSAWADRREIGARPPALRRASSELRRPDLVVSVATAQAARACLDAGADLVHVPAWELTGVEPEDGIVPLLPRITHDAEVAAYRAAANRYPRIVAATLGQLAAVAPSALTEAHWSLNAANAHAVEELAAIGARFAWLSPELSAAQLSEVASMRAIDVGLGVWGRQEVMVTEHCVLMSRGECNRQCATCARRKGVHYLKDRKGYRFPVLTDPTGRTHVYNSVELDLTEALPEILSAGVTAARLDADTLTPAEAARATAQARTRLDAAIVGRTGGVKRSPGTTTGHFFRGVS